MEYLFGSLFANFLSDWQIKNSPYKTAFFKVSSVSLCLLGILLIIHYHNFPKLTQDMILADVSISISNWLVLLAFLFLSIKTRRILKEDLQNPQ